jgi:hypothetical protein
MHTKSATNNGLRRVSGSYLGIEKQAFIVVHLPLVLRVQHVCLQALLVQRLVNIREKLQYAFQN